MSHPEFNLAYMGDGGDFCRDCNVYIRPGTTWKDVLYVTEVAGVHTIHGNCGEIGAVGCLLNGCIEVFKGLSTQIGLGVDNIVGFTAVLPTGHVVLIRLKEDGGAVVAEDLT